MSLLIDYNQLRREVGRFLGINRDAGFFEPDEATDIDDIIRSGLRRFYWHATLPGEDGKPGVSHSWSFLRQVKTLDLVASTSTYTLPEDFGELIEPVFTWAAGAGNDTIAVVSERHLRSLASQVTTLTGVPRYAALRPSVEVKGGKPLQEVLFYPTPTTAATLSYRASIIPAELDEDHPYPLGGAQHSETILESCLAAAEKTLRDEEGVHCKRYFECLATSIASDQKLAALEDPEVWPIDNVADGLTVNKAHLRRLIGRQLGIGSHESTWTHKQAQDVQLSLDAGLRKFYTARDPWSFLRPLLTIATTSSVGNYDLPADFAMLDGQITYEPDSSVLYPPIEEIGENQLRHYLQRQQLTGRPRLAAVSLKGNEIGVTTYELLLWPVPDDTYRLKARYASNPIALPTEVALPFGGQFHAQTVIECCLAAAELQAGIQDGPHSREAERLLERSIAHDQKAHSPEALGYNSDKSDKPEDMWLDHHCLNTALVVYGDYDVD